MSIGWLDCAAGASGDMFLGALVDAGVDLAVLQEAVAAVGVPGIALRTEAVTRGGLGATRVHVDTTETATTRTWSDVRALLEAASLQDPVRTTALDVFARLAAAEAAVHRVDPDDVHFHEVGALDAIADVVGAAAGLHALALYRLTASPVSLGSGSTRGAHGPLPVPAPAVLALLAGIPVTAGASPHEMCTPTGAALLATVVDDWGTLPAMAVGRVGMGAGGRDPNEVANVLRLVIGEPTAVETSATLLETNVDDLDPRLWPDVLTALMTAGASDAWLTPILMKKGRPAHTLSVLCRPADAAALRRVVFLQTSTIGLRESTVGKHALDRRETTIEVDGQTIRIKLASLGGTVVNTGAEYDDVVAAAAALGRPVRDVLLAAQSATQQAD
ncbi:MAG: nickel pincer cofactor biosynthesis protein LarC [Mycobacteriales bacterium]